MRTMTRIRVCAAVLPRPWLAIATGGATENATTHQKARSTAPGAWKPLLNFDHPKSGAAAIGTEHRQARA